MTGRGGQNNTQSSAQHDRRARRLQEVTEPDMRRQDPCQRRSQRNEYTGREREIQFRASRPDVLSLRS